MADFNALQEKIATQGLNALTESELAVWQIYRHDSLISEVRDLAKQIDDLASIHDLTEFASELQSHRVTSTDPVSQKKIDKSMQQAQKLIAKLEKKVVQAEDKKNKADAKFEKSLEDPRTAAIVACYGHDIRNEELARFEKFAAKTEATGEITRLSIDRIANIDEINTIETVFPNLPYTLYLNDEENILKPIAPKNK